MIFDTKVLNSVDQICLVNKKRLILLSLFKIILQHKVLPYCGTQPSYTPKLNLSEMVF